MYLQAIDLGQKNVGYGSDTRIWYPLHPNYPIIKENTSNFLNCGAPCTLPMELREFKKCKIVYFLCSWYIFLCQIPWQILIKDLFPAQRHMKKSNTQYWTVELFLHMNNLHALPFSQWHVVVLVVATYYVKKKRIKHSLHEAFSATPGIPPLLASCRIDLPSCLNCDEGFGTLRV